MSDNERPYLSDRIYHHFVKRGIRISSNPSTLVYDGGEDVGAISIVGYQIFKESADNFYQVVDNPHDVEFLPLRAIAPGGHVGDPTNGPGVESARTLTVPRSRVISIQGEIPLEPHESDD